MLTVFAPGVLAYSLTGYEAETVAAADRDLKDALGPLAYVVSGRRIFQCCPTAFRAPKPLGWPGVLFGSQNKHCELHAVRFCLLI